MLRIAIFLSYLTATVLFALLAFTSALDATFVDIGLGCVALGLTLGNLPDAIVVRQAPPQ